MIAVGLNTFRPTSYLVGRLTICHERSAL